MALSADFSIVFAAIVFAMPLNPWSFDAGNCSGR
jgi:hypothetical protein